ncbi:MAG: N-acetylneuraminate synthase family protein [Phycisphaerales bacterium]|nr:N-acetylneuraminate synthase family protein [Phycisphaerales bacterium]MCB9840461.1 N-acetylneuraminate synthase family protein [Phycisphaeraceae bacterium]
MGTRHLRIGDRAIGDGQRAYVIAEIGVNHDGSGERAVALTRAAAGAGADAVKLQVFRADLLMGRAARLAGYQEDAGETDPVSMLRRLELGWDACAQVVEEAHGLGLHAIATVFSVELVERAARLGFDAWKTASPDVVHRPLLEALAGTGRSLIVSTGAATMEEVGRAVGWLDGVKERLALLQCVSAYPTPIGQAELAGIAALRRAHPEVVVGYSDHTQGVETGALAVAHGAAILEKHFTYDTRAAGPDHAASLDADGLRRYVAAARGARVELRLADDAEAVKRVLEIEADVRAVSRQSIVAARAMDAGHVVQREDLAFRRPGGGMEPWRIGEVVGRVLGSGCEAGELLDARVLVANVARAEA